MKEEINVMCEKCPYLSKKCDGSSCPEGIWNRCMQCGKITEDEICDDCAEVIADMIVNKKKVNK